MSKKPNIILINCDDLGYGDLGCYGTVYNPVKLTEYDENCPYIIAMYDKEDAG